MAKVRAEALLYALETSKVSGSSPLTEPPKPMAEHLVDP
jgi:hypothetical protein